jgi:hypothetical protein
MTSLSSFSAAQQHLAADGHRIEGTLEISNFRQTVYVAGNKCRFSYLALMNGNEVIPLI